MSEAAIAGHETEIPTEIPPMTNKLGRHWDQPSRDLIVVDEKYALMSTQTWDCLHRYDCSVPSGVYAGKMWSSQHGSLRQLHWYGLSYGVAGRQGDYCDIHTREVLFA